VEPYLQRHPYANIGFGFASSRNHPRIFSHLSTPILTFSWSDGALPPMSPLRLHQIRIRLLALPTLPFFSRLSTPIFTHHEAVEPYLQRHTDAILKFKNEWCQDPVWLATYRAHTLQRRAMADPITFSFSKIFWALLGSPWVSCPLFSNSPCPATCPHIFSDISKKFPPWRNT